MKRLSSVLVLFAVGAGLLVTTVTAKASLTAPTLAIAQIEVQAFDEGALVDLQGSFPYETIVAQEYGLGLFIRSVSEGTRFNCFSSRWGPMSGARPDLAKGLTEKIVADIGNSAASTERAHFILVEQGRMTVQLEPDFPLGEAEAQFFVLYNGVPVFSNPVSFEVRRPGQ